MLVYAVSYGIGRFLVELLRIDTVERFTERGVPALNFGPGATAQAHQRGEWVEVEAMVQARTRLAAFLTGATT